MNEIKFKQKIDALKFNDNGLIPCVAQITKVSRFLCSRGDLEIHYFRVFQVGSQPIGLGQEVRFG